MDSSNDSASNSSESLLDFDPPCNSSTSNNGTTQGATDDLFRFITEGVLLIAVSLFGLVGNTMSIIVLTTASRVVRQGGASFSKLLRGLATFDALFLLIAIISFGIPQMSKWYTKNVFLYIMPIVFGLLHTFRVGSVYVTLAVTFERFHAIICPLKHFFWKKYLLPGSVSFAIIYNIPKYFEMEMKRNPQTNETTVVSTAMRQNSIYMSLYVFWSKFILIEIIPYVTIMVLNIFIIVKITKSARFRRQFRRHDDDDFEDIPENESENFRSTLIVRQTKGSNRSGRISCRGSNPRRTFLKKQQEEHTLGLILIGMSTLFIFCQSFKIIPDLYELIVCNSAGNLGHNCAISKVPSMNVVTRLSHLLVCLNSSTNFLIYYLNGEKFRQAWIETYGGIFRCFRGRRKNSGVTIVALQTLKTEIPVETRFSGSSDKVVVEVGLAHEEEVQKSKETTTRNETA